MRNKKKDVLVWVSNSPLSGTSFGTVTLELTKRIKKYKIYVLAIGYEGTPISPFRNLDILPLRKSTQLEYYFRKLKPERTVVFHSFYFLEQLKGIPFPPNTIGYIPVEGENLPGHLSSLLLGFDKLLVPSKYSQRILRKEGLKSTVVYHGVDTNYFTPSQVRPKEFAWGYLGLNDIRKQIPRIMEAYSLLPKRERGNLKIAAINEGHYNLLALSRTFKISPIWIEKKFLNIPLAQNNLLDFYRGLSCYVNCASEAFGLPNLEAMACGVPSIALDHGASKEILQGAALYVKTKDLLDTNVGQIGLADREDLYRKMKLLLEVPPERERLIKIGKKVVKQFSWEKAVRELEKELD